MLSRAIRDFSRASWRLKLARAEHHMKELEFEVGRYASHQAYRAVRVDHPDYQDGRWVYVLEITRQPPDQIAIILADVLANLRAALDHVAVALAPQRRENDSAWFPIVADIGLFDPPGEPISPERRSEQIKGWKSLPNAVRGMHLGAIAVIEGYQPYNVNPRDAAGNPQIHALLMLNRLIQADKHKRLIPITSGLERARSSIVLRTHVQRDEWYADFRKAGAPVAMFKPDPGQVALEAEVEVHLSGTPCITTEVVKGEDHGEIVNVLRDIIDTLATDMFPRLEPFIP